MIHRRTLIREMSLSAGSILTILIAISLVTLFIRLLGDVARGKIANEAVFAFLGFSLLPQPAGIAEHRPCSRGC
jgi:lipopolysaccharide export system permease protein